MNLSFCIVLAYIFFHYEDECLCLFQLWTSLVSHTMKKMTLWLGFLCVFILASVCIWHVSWEQVSHLSKTAHCSPLPVNYWTVNEGGKSYLTTHVLPLSRSSHFTLHPLLSVTPLPHYISVTRFPAPKFDMLPQTCSQRDVELICSC